jgi:hypothetical protein
MVTARYRRSLIHQVLKTLCGSHGSRRLWWQALAEQFSEGRDVRVTGKRKAVRLLKSSQGPLRGWPHSTVRKARIVAAAFQFALQAFNEVRGWGPRILWLRLGLRRMHERNAIHVRL